MPSFSSILPNLTGFTVSGHVQLRLTKILGNGSYGVVYLAHDLSSTLDCPSYYAVKVLLRHPADSPMAAFLEQEVKFLKLLSDNPHIVKLHEVIEEEHYMYLVMDYYPDGDLFSAIVDMGSFVQNDVLIRNVFLQLLDAVECCHDRGVYHRDIKPENIMCSEGQFYLGDFGLASGADTSKACGCGSSYYMSPGGSLFGFRFVDFYLTRNLIECIDHSKYRKPYAAVHADIWALGIVLINMITRNCPWHMASADDAGFQAFLREGPSYLRRALSISSGASQLLAGILEVDVSKRLKIDQIRRAVKNMGPFSDTLVELRLPTGSVKNVSSVQSCGTLTMRASFCPGHGSDSESIPSPYALWAFEDDIADAMSTFVNVPYETSCETIPRDVSTPALCSSTSQVGSSSGSDSEGPITPEALACDPVSVVSEFSLEETCALNEGEAGKQREPSVNKIPGIQGVVNAVQRMKIIS